MYMKTLAIFVPIYNIKSEYIEKCISSLRTARGYSTDFSVYIVDNASTNPEVNTTILKQIENTDFTHIRLRKNKGKPSAVRAAYKKITEDYIVTLDGDD
ncbi:MAG: hypothetical protein DRP42_03935 [Tenericutes bacterium]|nr:MAG: hypothetical protein DRP42_03935 [Mycoplasmatota bacterium]